MSGEDTEYMISIAEQYIWRASKSEISRHLTVNCIKDLEEYNERCNAPSGWHNINLLSISNINSPDDIKRAKSICKNAKINWNVMSGSLLKMDIEKIKSIVRYVDQVYLLLHKAPLGSSGNQVATFLHSLNIIDKLKDNSPQVDNACQIPDLASKFRLDGCMQDANKYINTGNGCSANISKFQIWPDGRVTGCAYNSQFTYGKQANTIEDIVSNLIDAKQRYEFSKCTIPTELVKYRRDK